MIHGCPPIVNAFSKGYHQVEHTDILYKLLKCDCKLVRSVLEGNGIIIFRIFRAFLYWFAWLECIVDEFKWKIVFIWGSQWILKDQSLSIKYWTDKERQIVS